MPLLIGVEQASKKKLPRKCGWKVCSRLHIPPTCWSTLGKCGCRWSSKSGCKHSHVSKYRVDHYKLRAIHGQGSDAEFEKEWNASQQMTPLQMTEEF